MNDKSHTHTHTPQETSQSSKNTTKRQLTLKRITTCSLEQQMKVREIRNQPTVRAAMYTDHEISTNEHLQWISRLKADKKQIVFAILNESNDPIGVLSANAIDTLHKKSDWAFYVDASERGGLGASLEYFFLNWAFNALGLEKINCEVIETNDAVVKLHKKFGFIEEGFRRENIEKNGERIGVVFLGLTKSDWEANKQSIYEKYEQTLNRFELKIAEEEAEEVSVLSQIEGARARNNINWMALLRLCIEEHPATAKPIVAEIMKLDTEISNLTKKLVS